jgi:catechol 2,3-dioxygenase-like lactoylglutathione lyase family enzyme
VNALEALCQVQTGKGFSIRGKALVREHGRSIGVVHERYITGSIFLLSHSLPRQLDVGSVLTRCPGRHDRFVVEQTEYDPAMSVRRIVPNINSADPSASRSFYEGVLGLDVAMDMGWIITFASPTNPTAQVSVVASDSRNEPHADISVEVADVDACHAAAQWQGFSMVYPLTDEPWGVRRFFVRDPNGPIVNVVSHKG